MSLRVCAPGLTSRGSMMVPAPTVSLVVSSIRMNAPLSRLSAYESATTIELVRSVTEPMSLSANSTGPSSSSSVSGSSRVCSACTVARTVLAVCLSASRSPARSGLSVNQHTVASSSRASTGRVAVVVTADEHVAAADVDVVGQLDRDRQRRNGCGAGVVEGVDGGDGRAGACGKHTTESPTLSVPADNRPV